MMKKLFWTVVMILVVVCSFAQESIIFKGTVPLNGKDKEVEVKEAQKTIATIPVKEDGTFNSEVPLSKMKQLILNYGVCSQPIFAKPGREVTINFGSEPKTAQFAGSPETEYYIDMRFLLYPGDISIIWNMPWHVYKKYQQDALASKMKYSEIFCKAYNDILPSFRKEVETFAIYSGYGSIITWPQFYKSTNKLTEFKEEADWKAYLESLFTKIEWNDPFLCGSPQYVSFAEYCLNEEIKKKENNDSFLLGAYDVIKLKITNKDVREFFMFHYTNKYLQDETPSKQSEVLAVFKADVTNQKYIAQLDRILADAKQFGSNAPAFDFTLEDVNGKMVTLSSFKGKVVYLDFWATWCAPCRAEIPHMNKLKEDLKNNKDIVVICVSTDQTKDKYKWIQMVKEMGMTDYQVFAGDKAADIQKYYKINGIPHFTIIGKDGKIYKNMTIRPSNPQTKTVLLGLAK